MARIMGCQNSMMLIIGDIASLEAEAPFLGLQSLRRSIIELEKRIHQHLEALESNTEVRGRLQFEMIHADTVIITTSSRPLPDP